MAPSDQSARDGDRPGEPDRPPAASIIIAARNAADFIGDALRSALAQTRRDIEVIVVDDGSVDDTAGVATACAHGDGRVRLLRHMPSQGVSSARNRAIAQARGDWIAVLDADDAFAPDRLDRLIATAEERGLDLLADNLLLRDFAAKATLGQAFPADFMARPELVTLVDLLERDMPGLPHKVFGYAKPIMRRAFLADHDLAYRTDVWCAEDFLLYADAVLAGGRFGTVDASLYILSERPGSASASGPAAIVEVARVNRLLRRAARGRAGADGLLALRQKRFDYLAFTQLLKHWRLRQAASVLPRVSIGYAARMLARAAARRLPGGRARAGQPSR